MIVLETVVRLEEPFLRLSTQRAPSIMEVLGTVWLQRRVVEAGPVDFGDVLDVQSGDAAMK
jgi:hypothetical protein